MHRYQVWVIYAILLALTPLSGLYGKQAQSSDNNNRHTYLEAFSTPETFSTLSNLDYLQGTHVDTEVGQLTLQLDDHIAQQEVVVVTHGESAYVIWRDLRNDQGDIYIQMLNADGQRMWPEDKKINDQEPVGTTQSNPAAAIDDNGNLWVVWVDDRQGQNDLYAQYLVLQSKSGEEFTRLGEDLRIPQAEAIYQANQAGPAVATHENDLIIVWHDNRNGIDFDIYAQRIGTDLEPQWPINDDPIHTTATGSQSDPAIAIDDAGNVMVAWLDQRVGNGDIYYTQRVLSNENPIEDSNWLGERQANEPEYSARKPPALVMGTDGVAQICWLSSTDMGNHVYLQTIDSKLDQPPSLSNQMITNASVNPGVKPTATLLGNRIAIGWKQIGDGHLHVDIREVDQLQGRQVRGVIDKDGANGNENRSQMLSLAGLNDNELFAVWVDTRSGRNTDIYGQKLDAEGEPAWSSARFINDSTGRIDQQNPAVAVDSQENSIVAWYSERGGQSNLFLQKFNLSGEPTWPRQIPVSNAKIQGQSLTPDLAVLGDDILITWSDRREGFSRVYVQRFDPEGNRVWHSDQLASRISEDSTAGQFNPQIAVDSLGGNSSTDIFIAWQESDETTSRVMLQKLDGEGAPVWSEDKIIVQSGTATLQFPMLALTNEEVVMAWTSTTLASTDLYIQTRDKEDGAEQSEPIRVNEFSGLVDQLNPPALAANPNGDTVVVWTDRRESAIYARGYDSQATPRWDAKKLNQTPGSFSPTPDIAFLPNHEEMVVVWQGLGQGRFFIYAQRLDDAGEPVWSIGGALDAEEAIKVSDEGSQEAWLPAIAANSGDIISIVWREERNKNQDIYLRRLNEDKTHRGLTDILVIEPEEFYHLDGIVRSGPVNEIDEQVSRALLTYEGDLNNGQIAFSFASGDGWESIQPGKIYTFTPPVTELRWQAQLTQTNVAVLDQSPLIEAVYINYSDSITSAPFGDVYEPDNTCGSAWPIQTDGTAQEHTLHNSDLDQMSFQVASNTGYILVATPKSDDVTLQVDIHRGCPTNMSTEITTTTGMQNNPAHLFLDLDSGTEYYVKVSSISTRETIPYTLSIRPALSGQAIVLAGSHDSGQEQVNLSAHRVVTTLVNNGFTLPYQNDQTPNAVQALENILPSITLTDSQTLFIVYLVGQIDGASGFKRSENEFLTASALDLWLTNLENAGKIGSSIVVIEANDAGSFSQELSGPNRIIVTSTSTDSDTEQTAKGFLFSDAFWLAMGQGYSVQQSFAIGKQVVEEVGSPCSLGVANCPQVPQLTDSSNLAQSSGLSVTNTQIVPVIEELTVSRMQTDSLKITTTTSPATGLTGVEYVARIRDALDDTGDIIGSPIELGLDSPTGRYSGILAPKPQKGRYYITIYGWDDNFALLPKIYEYNFQPVYLPIISR